MVAADAADPDPDADGCFQQLVSAGQLTSACSGLRSAPKIYPVRLVHSVPTCHAASHPPAKLKLPHNKTVFV